ncbi:T9SS type B sorting domain-containing protein [Psychroserpens sp.]|uniref:T9SS type B sorting domain-containing protein n=1 Tax=Psychroserpens sp. TaxID=2020870 RepID=UPI001B11D575|nr:T9SS type B sorting domain-containing protein [Psychroserpens sp.]MBO6606391.1 T9SS type B sorting domain-containing protein [Psychroserpens sp.]MBO6653095.1 T9SS type B sorting domain-containing protein [Psychroserpens sp.]MBO6680877.1 T9SS type B sorting domain-containing protein [Psychroserpens sp.]MBO6750165.1 T9SS type B sorting domain-containing protein [Psychroserpens sp.]MBO6914646.1 T9SS type B sorting domain-containing protein [Psychroserpens sp.]
MNKSTFSKIIVFIAFISTALTAYAQNYEPFTPRFDEDLKGDIILIGNNILGPDNNAFNNNGVYNHNVDMQYIDIDGDPTTFSSSSSDLDIPNPNCYRIIYAGLYWGAVNPGAEPITQVKFRGPVGGYNDIQGTIIYEAGGTTVDGGDSFSYACFADVTDIVTALGTDLGTYTVANVSSGLGETSTFNPYNGTGQSAGWSLFVVYEDPTLPGKSITSFDGFSAISVPGGNPALDIPVDGFRTVPAPAPVRANFAFATLEGDSPILGDRLLLNGVSLSTTDRPVNNFFNSSVTQLDATPVNNRVPNSTNTLGFDTGVLAIPNPGNSVIANDATSGVIRLETSGDTYFPYFFAFAVEIIEPDIVLTKIVEDDAGNDIGGQVVGLATPLNYVIGFQNIGNDNATNFQIRDILPINIVYNHPEDLVLPPGVTVASYDPVTRELIFNIDDSLVEENDPVYEIRIEVETVESCQQLADSCSNIINNQAFATYNGFYNPTFQITDDPSLNSNTGCLLSPQATNFLADLNDCLFAEDIILCGNSVELTAANGYDSYAWSTDAAGNNIIGTTQTITVTTTGTYYSFNTAIAPCQSIIQQYNVQLFGGDIENPVIPYADQVVTCPNDGKLLPNIFLCGADDSRFIQTNISGATSIIWEQLDETSCAAVTDPDCANEDPSCVWNEVTTGPDFMADTSGQFRLTINYSGGCFNQFYFNVYQNLLSPSVTATDIICTTPGSITVNDVPSGYEFSLDDVNYQTSNVFTITAPGTYTVYIRQIGIPTNPCVFTVPDVQIRARDFTVSTTILQPLCNGDLGSIQLAANDVEPQYSFAIYQGATLVNSVGPIIENTYLFENLTPGTYTATVETEDGCFYTEDLTIVEPPLLTVTAAITVPLTCTDGEITVYPQGGTPPYFYFINGSTDFQTVPEIVVTAPGTFDIEVIDSNNCSATTSITVNPIDEPEFTVATTDITCLDAGNTGTITINVTATNGNTLEYSIDGGTTYSNSPVFTGLAAGDYDVVVQYSIGGSFCGTTPQTVTIIANDAISGTADLTANYTCTSPGTITVTAVTGGDAPYMYSIDGVNFQASNVFTGLTAGTYTVTIQDANLCTAVTNDVVIDPLDPPTDMTFDNSPVTCPTNTSDVTITSVTGGTAPLEYQIIAPATYITTYQSSNVFTGLEPGTYTFQVRDVNDCTYSESYTINPIPTPTVNVVLTEGLDCTATPDATLTGTITGTAPFTYEVSIDGAAYTALGATGTTFTYSTATAGTYQFQITDNNGCTAVSSVITVDPVTVPNLTAVVQAQDILCNGDANASLDISIDPTVGTPPFLINVNNDTTGVNYGTQTSGLTAGTYTITITDANSCTGTETIVINEPDPIAVNYSTVDITCTASGVSQGSVIVDSVTGGTAPYNYFVTGSNGYSNSEFNTTGSTSVSFDVVDFGLYQINVVDTNGCSILVQDVLVASPPTDLDINVTATVDCSTGGEAVVSVGSTLTSAGPFFFSIYQGPISVYPNPPGSWLPEDSPGSESATFTGLTPGVTYTFIVYDASTNCTYYEPATTPIPTNSTLSLSALGSNNITCTGSADGNVSFTVNSIYGVAVNVDYEIFDSFSLISTGITGSGTVNAGGSLTVTDLGPLPFGNYFVTITETTGPNAGCGVVTAPFNITESAFLLDLTVSVDQNANCTPNSGAISAVAQNGTAPYQYQMTTTAAAPAINDANWSTNSTFNADAGNYYVHVIDAYNCIVTSPVIVLPSDPEPVISAIATNLCTVTEGNYEIDVTLDIAGIAPYSYSIDGGSFQNMTAPFTISNLFSGTHTIEIQDANGCGNLVSVDIPARLDIIPSITTLPSCNNDDGIIDLSVTGGTGTFTYTIAPYPASITLSGNTFTGVPSGLYTITIIDTVTSCTEEVTVVVPEATLPSVALAGTQVTCFGDNSGSFEINLSGYIGNYTYEVFDATNTSVLGPVSVNTSTNPLIVTGMTAGTFNVVITETDSPFCSTSGTVVINSPSDTLALTASESSNVSCDDSQGIISALATGGWGDYEYELSGDANIAFSSNNTFTDLSAGNYIVTVRDAEGCLESVNITLTAPNPITATFTPSASSLACFGDQNASITVTNVTGGQGTDYIYTLNTIAPNPSTSGPQTSNVFTDLGPGTYTIDISDGNACFTTSADIIINEPSPVEANLVVATTQTCLFETSLTLSATGGNGPYEFSATADFNTVLGNFNTSITFDMPVGEYQYYVRDANGCISNVSNEITIDPLLDLTINLASENPVINCAGDNTGSIVATAQGGLGDYVYTLQDTNGNDLNATQNTPGVFTELIAGTYVVFVESGDCDVLSAPITITEPSAPLDASFIVNNITCSGNNDGVLEINATGGTGIIKYAISPQLDQFFETNIFDNLAPGNYDVIVQDVLGCYITFNFTITDPEPVILTIVPNSLFEETCEGDNNAEFSIDISGGNLPYSVSLDDYDGPYTTGGPTQTIFEFTGLSGGDHIVYVRDAQNCESVWNITFPDPISFTPLVEVEFACVNNASTNTVTVTFQEDNLDMSEFDFSLDGGPFQLSNVFTDVAPGTDHYIDVRHSNGCIQTTEFFEIGDIVPVALILNEGDEAGEFVAIATGGTGDYIYIMNGENYGDTNVFLVTEDGTYTVTVIDSSGCEATALIEIEIEGPCIPNYFTPNGDGVSDTWAPECVEDYPNLTFDIFDRYGRKVAEYRVGEYWDGRYNGTELPTGDYWYVVRPNSTALNKEYVGHFTLYR